MKISTLAASLLLLPISSAFAQEAVKSVPLPPPAPPAASQAASVEAINWVQKQIGSWPEKTRRLAGQLITKYGVPADYTSRQLTWYDKTPWKRIELTKDEAQHNFASPHKNVLEQTISYRVPIDKLADLARFNGSLVANRTRGELSSSADSEDVNFLALNVADDIIKGTRDVEAARTYYAQIIRAKMIKEPEPDLQRLRFAPTPAAEAADPDEIAPLIKHMSGNDGTMEPTEPAKRADPTPPAKP